MNRKVINVLLALITAAITVAFVIGGVHIFSKQIEATRPITAPETSVIVSDTSDTSDSSDTNTSSADNSSSEAPSSSASSGSAVSEDQPSSVPPVTSSSDSKTESGSIPEGFFEDSLFIGDSRTVGLRDYGGLSGADFFASTGMSVYKINKDKIKVNGLGEVTLDELLKSRKYGKIYLMLGINELGYKQSQTIKKYSELVDRIKALQPQAKIILQANLHITQKRSAGDKIYNNANINAFNNEVAKLADNKTVYYIDVNLVFDDASGGLDPKYTSDNTHILGKYYRVWGSWICENSQL